MTHIVKYHTRIIHAKLKYIIFPTWFHAYILDSDRQSFKMSNHWMVRYWKISDVSIGSEFVEEWTC